MDSLLNTARYTMALGADHLRLSQADIDRLSAPHRSLEVAIPIDIEGAATVLRGWRVQHNLRRGPGKGGVRYSPNVNQAEVTGLATIMTLKNALADLPFGGAKGGVSVDTSNLDPAGRDQLAAQLAKAFGAFVGPDTDILGPDVGTGTADMDAFTTAWQQHSGSDSVAVATGKSREMGGIDARTGATARGCAAAIAVARERLSLGTDAAVAIQGFGALGRTLAQLLSNEGHPIVAVSDSGGGIWDPDGLDVDAVIDAKNEHGSVADAKGKKLASIEVLTVDAAIVVPAALQSIVGVDIASEIKADLVVEGSNAPSTVEGIRRMASRGLTVVPDFAANAGGVIGSFYEWSTNQGNEHDDAGSELARRVYELNEAMWNRSDGDAVDLRTAASALALEAIVDA